MEQRRLLPIGIQDFEKLRSAGCIYVDKTALVYSLASTPISYFLSRPRRFGKSLLVSTFDAYFRGRRDLFTGLAIEGLEKDWAAYPVLNISFANDNFSTTEALNASIENIFSRYEDLYGLTKREGQTFANRFEHIITAAAEQTGKPVVILIDEYDKPVLDALFTEQEEKNRAVLRGFYSPLKGMDKYIRFLFITGITKISQLNIFSGLNQLDDISMNADYAALCGISDSELHAYFMQEIESLAKEQGMSIEEAFRALAENYDGYHFARNGEGVYNPFCLLKALREKNFGSYWFESGTPSLLVTSLQNTPVQLAGVINGRKALEAEFKDYDPATRNLLPVIYQSGYLTIKGYDRQSRIYTLGFPNREVEDGFLNAVLPRFISVPDDSLGLSIENLRRAFLTGNLDAAMEHIQAAFCDIPVILQKKQCENYYESIFHVLLRMTGFRVTSELQSIGGRSDIVFETGDAVYIFELKMDRGRQWQEAAAEALAQIERKGYASRFAVAGKSLRLVGVVFSDEAKGLLGWQEAEQSSPYHLCFLEYTNSPSRMKIP